MAQAVKDIMTKNPITLPDTATVREAAVAMREGDVGDVIVMRDSTICGIVTDRDIAVRAVADGKSPDQVKLTDIVSADLVSVTPEDSLERAVELMRDKAVRRLPVVKSGKPVGVVSIGDLAMERDARSALADISAASPNT